MITQAINLNDNLLRTFETKGDKVLVKRIGGVIPSEYLATWEAYNKLFMYSWMWKVVSEEVETPVKLKENKSGFEGELKVEKTRKPKPVAQVFLL